jgi:addiction module HigA family antidote
MTKLQKLPNPATGLISDTLDHFSLTKATLAKACQVSGGLISDTLSGKKRISTELALRFELALGIRAGLILDLQQEHEIAILRNQIIPKLEKDVATLV